MDLGAYAQIGDLTKIAEENGIEVPRLRGYRLMSEETPINYKDWCENIEIDICNNLCEADPFWNPNTCCYVKYNL